MARQGPPPLPALPRTLPGAASRSYTVASTWEQLAVLTDEQEKSIDWISQTCAERPVPDHIVAVAQQGPQASEERQDDGSEAQQVTTSLEEAVLENSNQFHRWHSELEAARELEAEEKYQEYASTLKQHLTALKELQEKVQGTLQLLEELRTQHAEVASKSKALHSSCEKLVAEKDRLVDLAEAIKRKLAYFDELEKLATKFHSASLSIDSEDFLGVLKRLDDCLSYVSNHLQYADSAAYASKFRHLQSRALSSIRTRAHQILKHAADQVQAAMRAQAPSPNGQSAAANGVASSPSRQPSNEGAGTGTEGLSHSGQLVEGAEAALLYVRFRAAAESGLRGLLQGLEARAHRAEYAQLLSDCQRMYCEIRLLLVGASTHARIQSYAKEPLPLLTRRGWSFLIQVCQMETQLFEQLFPGSHNRSGALSPLIDSLADMLYDTLRPAYIHLQDLGSLCQLVQILKNEILEEQIDRRGKSVAQLRTVLLRTLADVQHRLTYRAQAFIKESVTGYQPKPEDLDYPNKLLKLEPQAGAAVESQQEASDDQDASRDKEQRNGDANAKPSSSSLQESGAESTEVWYPPLRETLLCLGKLYRCLEPQVFAGLAQDAVSACTAAVQLASRALAKKHQLMDGQLFLIKQLLILREQIAPFESEFSHVEKDLDFSHMRSHLRRIMAGQSSLFSLSSNNAMLQLVSRGGPRILENQVDSKKEVEKVLKATCEMFIMGMTKQTVDPMLSFITKVTAVRVRSKHIGASNVTSGPAPPQPQPLRAQAFAAPERVIELVQQVRDALSTKLPAAMQRMKLYLKNPATHAILFRPIKSNIVEAHGQIASLLEAEYSKEEVAAVKLASPQELSALLDTIC